MAKIYGEVGGKVLEIQNWNDRASGSAVIMQRLSDADAALFRQYRNQGMEDRQIWDALHPETEVVGTTVLQRTPVPEPLPPQPAAQQDPLSFRFDDLPTEQLVWMIEQVMGQRADSLAKLAREDLLNLARFATKGRSVQLTFIP